MRRSVSAGGRQSAARATFQVQKGSTVIGSCDVDLPTIGNGETERIGCRVNWDTSIDVSADVAIMNPE